MTQALLRKRDRELETLPDSINFQAGKRLHSEETDRFLNLLQLDQTLADDDLEEEFAPSEEIVKGVMRSLEEEIAPTCSTSYRFSNSGDNSAAPDISRDHEGQTRHSDSRVDLSYLLEASDDDLGIPPSPVRDLTEEFCQSSKETSEGLPENPNLKSLGENWNFEDDFEKYQHVEFYANAWDEIQLEHHLSRDFDGQTMLFDGEFVSAAWRLETAGGM
jgi:hypothetical protein